MNAKVVAHTCWTLGFIILVIAGTVKVTRYIDACQTENLVCIEGKLSAILGSRGYVVFSEVEPISTKDKESYHEIQRERSDSMEEILAQSNLVHVIRAPEDTFLLLEEEIPSDNEGSITIIGKSAIHKHTDFGEIFRILFVITLKESANTLPALFPLAGIERVVRDTSALRRLGYWEISGLLLIAIGIGISVGITLSSKLKRAPASMGPRVLPPVPKKRPMHPRPLIVERLFPTKEDPRPLRIQAHALIEQKLTGYPPGHIHDAFEALKKEVSTETRPTKLRYLISHRIPAVFEEGDEGKKEESEALDTSRVLTKEEEAALDLPIEQFLPDDVSPRCVKAILIALLGIGSQAPFFGERRCRYEDLHRWVINQGYKPKEWENSFAWLRKQGVVSYVNPHRRGFICSINPHIGKGETKEGEAIIGIAIRLRQEMARRR